MFCAGTRKFEARTCCILFESVLFQWTNPQTEILCNWQIDVRRLKIAYSDSEGLPVAYIFHKKILLRSLQAFSPELGFALYCAEVQEGSNQQDLHDDDKQVKFNKSFSAGRTLSEEELETSWSGLSTKERKDWARQEEGKSTSVLRRANYKMLAYREELLRWLVDLIRSPLPTEAIHWYV